MKKPPSWTIMLFLTGNWVLMNWVSMMLTKSLPAGFNATYPFFIAIYATRKGWDKYLEAKK